MKSLGYGKYFNRFLFSITENAPKLDKALAYVILYKLPPTKLKSAEYLRIYTRITKNGVFNTQKMMK